MRSEKNTFQLMFASRTNDFINTKQPKNVHGDVGLDKAQ